MMTRCLDCGSERATDQCPSCGLTSAAAEVMFRRRLVWRTAIFLLGALAFPYVSQIYPPLDIDLMLIFFGVIFFGVLFLAVILERCARNRQEIEILKRIYSGFIPLPWILAATLFTNGRLDSPKNITYYPTSVEGRFNMKGIVHGSRRFIPGAQASASSAWPSMPTISIAFATATPSKSPSNPALSASRGTTASTAAERSCQSLVLGFQ
jgi:hypothetical protein